MTLSNSKRILKQFLNWRDNSMYFSNGPDGKKHSKLRVKVYMTSKRRNQHARLMVYISPIYGK